MNRRQVRIFVLSLIRDTEDDLLGWDAPWRNDYADDAERIELALEHYYDILSRKFYRLKKAERDKGT